MSDRDRDQDSVRRRSVVDDVRRGIKHTATSYGESKAMFEMIYF